MVKKTINRLRLVQCHELRKSLKLQEAEDGAEEGAERPKESAGGSDGEGRRR